MRDIYIFISAAFFEILGCFAFWSYFKLHKSPSWLISGIVSLVVPTAFPTKAQRSLSFFLCALVALVGYSALLLNALLL